MRVLIGGGTGFVGKHLSRLLMNKGHEVILVSRKVAPGAITWSDLNKGGLPNNLGAIVNLAGQNLMDPTKRWNASFEKALTDSRIKTTQQFTQLINKAEKPPPVYVTASAVGYYKPSETVEYTEDSKGGDSGFLATLCRDWENAGELKDGVKCRRAVVRIGLALGRDGGTIQNLVLPFWLGLGGRIGSGKQWFPWIHVDDVAGIIVHAIENDHVTGVLNGVAPEVNTNSEFTAAFAKALGRPACIPVPGFALQLVYGSERTAVIMEGQKVIPKRTLESGYKFIYPDLASACKEFAHISN